MASSPISVAGLPAAMENVRARICASSVMKNRWSVETAGGKDRLSKARRGELLSWRESATNHPAQVQVSSVLTVRDTTYLPPPEGAGEFMACTMSVVRASSKLVMNSTFFPSGQPGRIKKKKKKDKAQIKAKMIKANVQNSMRKYLFL